MSEENFKSIESLNFTTVSWDIQNIIIKEPLAIVKSICSELIIFFIALALSCIVKLDYELISKTHHYRVYAQIKSMDGFLINERVECFADAPIGKVPKLNFKNDIIYILRYKGFGKYVYYGLEESSKECFEKSIKDF